LALPWRTVFRRRREAARGGSGPPRDAVRRAEASPVPDGSTVTEGVYAELVGARVDEH
jgi:hypothetical protein